MSLLDLKSKNGKKKRKRVGRGIGSGHGTFSCKGCKGQTARSGGRRRPGFEGGQTPYLRKLPKLRGFKKPNQIIYQVVNLGELNVFEENSKIDAAALYEKNIISKKNVPVKLLAGKAKLSKSLTIMVHRASNKAQEEISALKGTLQLLKKIKETN